MPITTTAILPAPVQQSFSYKLLVGTSSKHDSQNSCNEEKYAKEWW